MRAWLLLGNGQDPCGLQEPLRAWAGTRADAACALDALPLDGDLLPRLRAERPDLLVLAADLCPGRPWAEEVLTHDVALLVAAAEAQAEPYLELANSHPVFLVPPRPSPEGLGLALRTALAGLRRCRDLAGQGAALRQRLEDRIIIERAKGVLVGRLGVGEEEAYRRMRLLARRQRRTIRDIARSLLETQALLLPPDLGGPASGTTPAAVPPAPPPMPTDNNAEH
jgi:response regulator NasT